MSETKRRLKVFLCHASADKPAVRDLHHYLIKRGISSWLDEFSLLAGDNWRGKIQEAIFAADIIIVCLSKNSINKEGFVQSEIVFALDKARGKPEGTIFIIPARLEECAVPSRLREYHWVDLFQEGGHNRLIMSLNQRATQLGPEILWGKVIPDLAKIPTAASSRHSLVQDVAKSLASQAYEESGKQQSKPASSDQTLREAGRKEITEQHNIIKTEEDSIRTVKAGRTKEQLFQQRILAIVLLIVLVLAIVTIPDGSQFLESLFSPVPTVTVTSSVDYSRLLEQAVDALNKAKIETDPRLQRQQLQKALDLLAQADQYMLTDGSKALRAEAQMKLDRLIGIKRLNFLLSFWGWPSSTVQITRMAASENDLYMLEAEDRKILRASFDLQDQGPDRAFSCQPGTYGAYDVGPLIDLLVLPEVNAFNATVVGIDAVGNLLYCAPDQAPKALPLPALPNTNWGHIVSFALDNDNLYVLDAQSRAVWVFAGKDSIFMDTPYFYFGSEIPANINSAIDLAAVSDDLYMLHADGHLSYCTFSRILDIPTRCLDPAPRVDNYPAHGDMNIFESAQFTQIAVTDPPNSVILLLDSVNQSVFQFSARSFELQNWITGYAGKDNPFKNGSVDAMAVGPDNVLYLVIDDYVYAAANLP